jgi:mRNA interferase RelE/StbE
MYTVEYTRTAAKEFAKLPSRVQSQIQKKMADLALSPFSAPQVKALKGEDDSYRLRVGDYRVVYMVLQMKLVITVVRVAHRKEVYS